MTHEDWRTIREEYLETGHEIHPFFNIARKVEGYAVLDFLSEADSRRLLCYPNELAEGPQVLSHPTLMPFKAVTDGALTEEGVDVRKVPHGTRPMLRVAETFDSAYPVVPTRAALFHKAGEYLGTIWRVTDHYLPAPEDFGLEMLGYTPLGRGIVTLVPPIRFEHVPEIDDFLDSAETAVASMGVADRRALCDTFLSGFTAEARG